MKHVFGETPGNGSLRGGRRKTADQVGILRQFADERPEVIVKCGGHAHAIGRDVLSGQWPFVIGDVGQVGRTKRDSIGIAADAFERHHFPAAPRERPLHRFSPRLVRCVQALLLWTVLLR